MTIHIYRNTKIFVGNIKIFVYDIYIEKQNELILSLGKMSKKFRLFIVVVGQKYQGFLFYVKQLKKLFNHFVVS